MDIYKRRRIDAHIDLVPMIDTLLQLFLIFLLSATFVSSSLNLDLPKAGREQKNPGSAAQEITVSMDAASKLYLNGQPVKRDDLISSLQSLLKGSKTSMVMLLADRKLVYEQVLEVLVEIQGSGANKVLLAYDKKPAEWKKM